MPTAVNATAGNTSAWTEIAAGFNHTCGVRQDKSLWCWGRNASGQLGDGTTTTRTEPKQVTLPDAAGWVDVAASGDFTCALRENGDLYCWGVNTSGQIGQGDVVSPVNTPKQVPGAYAAIDVSANHACGVRKDGTLHCWGRNANSELGIGNAVNPILVPTQVGAAADWVRPFLGQGLHTCALKTNGDLYCWGNGSFGQLGLGSLTSFNTPQKALSLGAWKSASIGNEHSCGLSAAGALFCWGAANYAQLASGIPFVSTPTKVLDPL